MKAFTLVIDTSRNDKITVLLKNKAKEIKKQSITHKKKAQMVLPLLVQMMNEHNLHFDNITDIVVHTGPGSFTGLRVGVAIAQALAFVLAVPVCGTNDRSLSIRYT